MNNILIILIIIILGILFLFPNYMENFCGCIKRLRNKYTDTFENYNTNENFCGSTCNCGNRCNCGYNKNLNQKKNLLYEPYNPIISTPQTNYDYISSQIQKQNEYKKDLTVALNPIPTIQCAHMHDKETCNKYGCNWYGNRLCSATYPTQY